MVAIATGVAVNFTLKISGWQFEAGNSLSSTNAAFFPARFNPTNPLARGGTYSTRRIVPPPLRDTSPPPVATDSSMITTAVIMRQQEYLSALPPLPTILPGVQGPDVAPPPQIGGIFAVQEQPSTAHPTSRVSPGIQGPNVAALPQIGEVLVQQEPGRAGWFAGIPGIQGPNVAAPPQIGRLVTVQELPGQPPSVLQHRIFGLNVRAPVSDQIILRQQTPDHPPSAFLPGIQGPNVRPPSDALLVLKPQDPVQPPSVLRTGTVGPANQDQLPPQGRFIILRQQQPDQPPPLLLPSVLPPPPIAGAFVVPGILVQEQWLPLDHPLSRLAAGVQGPNVAAPPQIGRVWIVQEMPGHPASVLRMGTAGPAGQEQTPRQGDRLLVLQELPGHPGAIFSAGVTVPPVNPAVLRLLQVRQELPGHPSSLLQQRIFGLNVRTPVTDWTIGRQQQPDQPLPLLLPSLSPIIQLPAVSRGIILRQQQPDQPPPIVFPGVYTQPLITPVPPDKTWVVVSQEWPWHPSSIFWHWQTFVPTPPPPPPPPRQHVKGNMVWLLADFVYSPDPPPTRTVFLVSDPSPRGAVATIRTVHLLPDTEGKMQLPGLLSWGPTGPMDDDPFTIDATSWLATIPGDTIASVTANVYLSDGTAQSDVSITALTNDTTTATVWLTGGVPGTTYRVTFNLRTIDGRIDRKSVALLVVMARS